MKMSAHTARTARAEADTAEAAAHARATADAQADTKPDGWVACADCGRGYDYAERNNCPLCSSYWRQNR